MLANIDYVPSLKTRVSEVEAYSFLSDESKDRTLPLFQLRPWPNANHLQHAVDKVQTAIAGRPFGFGLDIERRNFPNEKPAQAEFDALFDGHLGYRTYFDYLRDIPGAIPVLNVTHDAENLLHQLGNAADLDRGLIVHQRRDVAIPISDTIIGLPPLPHDTVFVVDAGWTRDPLQLQNWALSWARRIFQAVPTAELVVMASSFPDSFSHIVGNAEEPAHENGVFELVQQQLQEANLTYGDWGSTRLSQTGGGGRIPPRVDVPRPASWQIFRADPDGEETYADLADDAQGHECFQNVPDCWGKIQIAATDGSGTGITGVKMNTSCRINIHMTIKSGASRTLDLDEQPYED